MLNVMSTTIEFTGNYQDLSTDRGYQFKFFCEKCGNGYMSSYQASKLGMARAAIDVANSVFGGIFGRASAGAYEVQRAVGGVAHDAALREAVEEIRPKFKQCTRCGAWVCEPVCWNHQAGLCERCAPELAAERAAAQAEAAREQVHAKAREVDWVKNEDVATVRSVACPACGAEVGAAKFCPECGEKLVVKPTCGACGAEIPPKSKFCPECGERV
jgi:hypothetical protein